MRNYTIAAAMLAFIALVAVLALAGCWAAFAVFLAVAGTVENISHHAQES
jgi:hypothetical protein